MRLWAMPPQGLWGTQGSRHGASGLRQGERCSSPRRSEKTSRGQSDERGLKAQALPAAQAAACDRDGSARACGRPWCQNPEGNRHIHSPIDFREYNPPAFEEAPRRQQVGTPSHELAHVERVFGTSPAEARPVCLANASSRRIRTNGPPCDEPVCGGVRRSRHLTPARQPQWSSRLTT